LRNYCALAVLLSIGLLSSTAVRAAAGKSVVIYTSQDEVYAEPILDAFTRQIGIKVGPVFDSEAVKTVGLANRLLAERTHPQCDVFWSNEELRTRQLAAQGVFREAHPWVAVGYRSRRMVINTNRLALAQAPHSLTELTNAVWSGKVALAYPLFGTTATHFLALRQLWGAARWEAWCRALAGNKTFVVDGNSVAAKMVGRGEAWVGLTDSDDIAAEQSEGAPLLALPISEETLLIPNTSAVVRQAPHPEAAEKLWEYLQRPEVTQQLITAKALEGISVDAVKVRTLAPNWNQLLEDLGPATATLKSIFLR
jgi:iron(III) transport system substrate-binding protein